MSQITTLYLVRHGQTEWNVEHRLQGHRDSPLTDLGIRQAQWLGESMANERIDLIYTSSSARALRTAEIIRGGRMIDLVESQDLKEINLGVWEGKAQAEVKKLYPEQFDYFWSNPAKFSVPESESFQEVYHRAQNRLQQIIQDNQGKTVMIVTHTVIIKLMMAYFENRPLKELWNPPYIHPACLCKVELDGDTPRILLHGDISHYQEKPAAD